MPKAERGAGWARGPAAACLGALLLGLALVGGSAGLRGQMAARLEREQARLAQATGRLEGLGRERRELREHRPLHVALGERGWLGQESRADWIETLRRSAEALRLPRLGYRLEARAPAASVPASVTGSARLFESPMLLELELLHEGELLSLLERLQREARGLHSVSSCEIERAPPGRPAAPRLIARCALAWWTLEAGATPLAEGA